MAMRKSFDEVLQECIRRLETTGGDVEAVLASYPDRAAELRPHLQVWARSPPLRSLRRPLTAPCGAASSY